MSEIIGRLLARQDCFKGFGLIKVIKSCQMRPFTRPEDLVYSGLEDFWFMAGFRLLIMENAPEYKSHIQNSRKSLSSCCPKHHDQKCIIVPVILSHSSNSSDLSVFPVLKCTDTSNFTMKI